MALWPCNIALERVLILILLKSIHLDVFYIHKNNERIDIMDNIFDTSTNVDPALFGEEGNSTDSGAENQTTQSTNEEGTQNTNQENMQQQAPETDTQSKLLAGKYKSPEDLEKAYQELQKSFTKATMELSQAKNAQPANPAQQDTSQNVQQDNQQQVQQIDWHSAFQQDPINTMYHMAKLIAQEEIQGIKSQIDPIANDFELGRQVDAVVAKYSDFPEYAEKVGTILGTMPELEKLPNHLEVAYKMAKSDVLAEQVKTAFDAGKNAAYQLDQQKQNNVFDNNTTRNEAQKTPEQEIMEGILNAGGGGWRSFGI